MRNRRPVPVAWIKRRHTLRPGPHLWFVIAEHPTEGWTEEDRAAARVWRADERAIGPQYGLDRKDRHRKPWQEQP